MHLPMLLLQQDIRFLRPLKAFLLKDIFLEIQYSYELFELKGNTHDNCFYQVGTNCLNIWCSAGATSTIALSPSGRRCESAKLGRRKCRGEGAKMQRWSAKRQKWEGEGTILLSRLHNFALSPSHFRLCLFMFMDFSIV